MIEDKKKRDMEIRTLKAVMNYAKVFRTNVEGYINEIERNVDRIGELKEYLEKESDTITNNEYLIEKQLKRISNIEKPNDVEIQLLDHLSKIRLNWISIHHIVDALKTEDNKEKILKCFDLYSDNWKIGFGEFDNTQTIIIILEKFK